MLLLPVQTFFYFMPLKFVCHDDCLMELDVNINVKLIEVTINDKNDEISKTCFIDVEEAKLLIKEIEKLITIINKKNEKGGSNG